MQIFCKKWHIHLYMSLFFSNFARKIVVIYGHKGKYSKGR